MSALRAACTPRMLAVVSALLLGALPASAADAPEAEEQAQAAGQDSPRRSGWGRQQAPDPEMMMRDRPGPKTLERHANALEHLFEERYEEAEQELDKLYFKRMNPVEQAMIHRDYAFVANARGDRDEARRRLEAAIATGGFLPKEVADARFQIAMLWMQEESWENASATLEQWFTEEPEPNAASHYILALTYFQQQDYEKARVPARKAVEMSDEPKEGWLQLLLAMFLLEKDFESSLPVLEQLVSLYPSKNYFMNLSTVHGALGSYEEAAVPLQLAYEKGLLDADEDLRRLGQLMMFLNLPYRAARLLEKGLEEQVIEVDSDVLAMLSNSWIAAREYDSAVAPLERAAAMSEDGELFVRLAQVHVQRENWDGAAGALGKALAKGKLKEPGDANLLMGIALYSQGKTAEARSWFERSLGFEKAAEEARVWLQHIDQELAGEELAAEDAEEPAETGAGAPATGG